MQRDDAEAAVLVRAGPVAGPHHRPHWLPPHRGADLRRGRRVPVRGQPPLRGSSGHVLGHAQAHARAHGGARIPPRAGHEGRADRAAEAQAHAPVRLRAPQVPGARLHRPRGDALQRDRVPAYPVPDERQDQPDGLRRRRRHRRADRVPQGRRRDAVVQRLAGQQPMQARVAGRPDGPERGRPRPPERARRDRERLHRDALRLREDHPPRGRVRSERISPGWVRGGQLHARGAPEYQCDSGAQCHCGEQRHRRGRLERVDPACPEWGLDCVCGAGPQRDRGRVRGEQRRRHLERRVGPVREQAERHL
mmetsp:Transcript_9397/g.25178  ORF Transcript_9397/g.25178 Transcript_9397/m.25178 type:complete len:307 (+) Transcript_9397:1027-1947(+)